jgi:hypothetical protein
VTVPVVRIWEVGMNVFLRRVSMWVSVLGISLYREIVLVVMVFVMDVLVFVFKIGMGMLVGVMLGQV